MYAYVCAYMCAYIIAYDMMHKLTLVTYMITSLLQKHSIKNNQKFSLCIPSRNNSQFQYLQRNFAPRFPNSRATQNSLEHIF